MLALRLQRTGRKKIANYRVIAQEHRFQPTSGKVVAYLGHYNPHTKDAELETEQIQKYLDNGAHPSDAAARLFKKQDIKLPDWVSIHEYDDKKEAREAAEKAEAKATEAEAKATKPDKEAEAPAGTEDEATEEAKEAPAGDEAKADVAEEAADDSIDSDDTPAAEASDESDAKTDDEAKDEKSE